MTPDRYCDLVQLDAWRDYTIGRITLAEYETRCKEARRERDAERRLDDMEDEL